MATLKELREKKRKEEEMHDEVVSGLLNALLMAINEHKKISPTLTTQDVVNAISVLTYVIHRESKETEVSDKC
jgi:hypothetical protein